MNVLLFFIIAIIIYYILYIHAQILDLNKNCSGWAKFCLYKWVGVLLITFVGLGFFSIRLRMSREFPEAERLKRVKLKLCLYGTIIATEKFWGFVVVFELLCILFPLELIE